MALEKSIYGLPSLAARLDFSAKILGDNRHSLYPHERQERQIELEMQNIEKYTL